ncbi:MAG: PatB family C-S lyase [Rikenellaceae bacterium]
MYNFDEIIDRTGTCALNTDGFRHYIFNNDSSLEFKFKDEEFIRMWVADMEFATPEVILDAIRERLDRRIFGYTMLIGDSYYKTFSKWCLDKYDWSFAQEELMLSSGVVPALKDLTKMLTKEGEKILFTAPSYAYFKYAAEGAGREWVCTDLQNTDGYFTIDFEDLERKASDPLTSLFIFCNPQNPTGRVFSEEELHRVAEIIEKNDLWVISDEIHCDLLRCGKRHIPLGKVMPDYKKLVTCMAPSKTFNLAGMLFSNIIIRDSDLRTAWEDANESNCNPLSLTAAEAAYAKGGEWLEALKSYLDSNFEYAANFFKEHLPKAVFTNSEATYLAWIDLSAYFDSTINLPLHFAQEAGVLLEGGSMFVQNSDSFIRLNLACPKSTLKEGLKRIISAIPLGDFK